MTVKNEIKEVYKKDRKLGIQVAKALGYKIVTKKVESKEDVKTRYNTFKKEINDKMVSIKKLLKIHDKEFSKEGNWGYVGDYGHVLELLTQIEEFLS